MKKIFTFTALLLIAATLLGQAPASFKYQAVLRDARGNVKADVSANIKIDILQGSSSGNIVYSENHSVTTNMYGLINLEVGNGVATIGSFSAIDWGTNTYFLKIFVDGVEMGTDQLLSVPYALNAKTAEKVTGKLIEMDPVFLASPAMGITSGNLTNWTTAFSWGNHATAGYLKAASPNDLDNWNTAFSWGNHAAAGYLKAYNETDPAFLASPAGGITATNIAGWNGAVNWGDHALAGYLKSNSENDPIFKASPASGITTNYIYNWNTAFGWGNHAIVGYLKSYAETDPAFLASPASGITSTNITGWNIVVGWGNHASAGYLKSYTETDPLFTGWDKKTGISLTSAQVSDFETTVTNNPAVQNNTAKISYPVADAKKLAGIADGAEVNVNADWNAVSGDAKILNKPTLAIVATTGDYKDLSNKPTIPAGTNPGDMQYWNGTAWIMVPVGMPGQVLSLDDSNIPSWQNASSVFLLPPTATSLASTNLQSFSASLNGVVNAKGLSTTVVFEWGQTTAYGNTLNASESPVTGNLDVEVSRNLTGLQSASNYHYRIKATNPVNVTYSGDMTFTTSISVPQLTTTSASAFSILAFSATTGGNITYDGGSQVTERGVCYSTSSNPTTANSTINSGTDSGSFASNLTGLIAETTYYVRAYATNSAGTAYGNEVSFKTIAASNGKAKDIDGNVYLTVTIETQVWMAENLKTTKYNDGTSIPLVTDGTAWGKLVTPGYCWYINATSYKDTYGALYNWYAVNTGKLCPTGWHMPTDAEWTILTTYLGGESVAGGKLKETGTSKWLSPNTDATNTYGFTAVPGGYRTYYGMFDTIGHYGTWWSSTEYSTDDLFYRLMTSNNSDVNRLKTGKVSGLSVRCIQDFPSIAPAVSTTAVSEIAQTTATSGGNVTADGGAAVTARGVCWSISANPTTANSKTSDAGTTGTFSSSITGLTAGTTYYVRAYAINSLGVSYGNERIFITPSAHYYRFVSSPMISWTAAKIAAESDSMKYEGLRGYLATITSAEENAIIVQKVSGPSWIGASDEEVEGDWRWVTGPEGLENGGQGRYFWRGTGAQAKITPTSYGSVNGEYHNWNRWNVAYSASAAPGTWEPNQSGNEDYAFITFFPTNPADSYKWNDIPNTGGNGDYVMSGYIIEYGGMP